MGRPRKMSATQTVAKMKSQKSNERSSREILVDLAIGQGTQEQYASRIRFLEEVCTQQGMVGGLKGMTENIFLDFLNAVQLDFCGGTAEGYRSALQHWHEAGRLNIPWISSVHVIKACRGFRYRGGETVKRGACEEEEERATIEEEQFNELMVWLKKENPDMATAVEVQYGSALRVNELIALRRDSFDPKNKSITIDRDKRYNARTCAKRTRHYEKVVRRPATIRALLHLQKTAEEGQLLFPPQKWRVGEYRSTLQRAAKELGWPTDGVKYDGTHILRHGGVRGTILRRIKEQKRKGESLVPIEEELQLSKAMVRHYGRSNDERRQNKKKSAKKEVAGARTTRKTSQKSK